MKRRSYKPLSQSVIRDILASNPSSQTKEDNTQDNAVDTGGDEIITLHRQIDYDSLDPEQQLRTFLQFTRAVSSRYDENARLIAEYEAASQDLLHYAELHDNLGAADGCAIYKKLREIRRARRACKNENDLLRPLYEFLLANKGFTDQLAQIQGICHSARETIDARRYTLRTSIMSDRHAQSTQTEGDEP